MIVSTVSIFTCYFLFCICHATSETEWTVSFSTVSSLEDLPLQESENSSYSYLVCDEDRTYPSLGSCFDECERKANESRGDNSVLFLDTSTASVRFKVVVFHSNEYIIDDDMNLLSSLGSFNRSMYHIVNESAYLCYPLAAAFIHCEKWLMESYEYDIDPKRGAWVWTYEKYYAFDEFYLTTNYNMMALCIPDDKYYLQVIQKLHLIGYLLSAIFLVVAFVASLFLKGIKQRSNRPLQCHMVMLLSGYMIVSTKYAMFKGELKENKMKENCIALACLQQFFFLSAFFWINSQAIDLYIALKDLRPNSEASKRRRRRFIFYCIYSWGIPAAICSATVLAEKTHHADFLYPGFQNYCWFYFEHQLSAFLFYYGWMAVVIVANVILFLLIVRKFHQMGQEVFIANKNIHKQLLRISIKLVIVMGFFWVIKVAIWGVGRVGSITSVVDMLTSLQGFFVFMVYVCKIEILKDCLICSKSIRSQDDIVLSDTKSSVLSSFIVLAALDAEIAKAKIVATSSQKQFASVLGNIQFKPSEKVTTRLG